MSDLGEIISALDEIGAYFAKCMINAAENSKAHERFARYLACIDRVYEIFRKRLEARVLTLTEVSELNGPGYVEYNGDCEVVDALFRDDMTTEDTVGMWFVEGGCLYCECKEYGSVWRVWTQKPTEEERKAAKWNEREVAR